ncbi:MAG: ribose-phosphate pyrophosphokinase [Blautia sp.]|nr:ribose-phosphate pyrophosphokinase [Blautia sp.]
MAQLSTKDLTTLPVGRLGLIPLESCSELGQKVNDWLVQWRKERTQQHIDPFAFDGYQRDNYMISVQTPRFGSGEGKCVVAESVRGDDIYIMVDVCNYSLTYRMGAFTNLMSPDDHFQDLKRVIGAIGGKARRVNVIMPYLYESRQSKRVGRESLDCATALQELTGMGVENIITFDAHDARVQNATPLHGFETVQPSYQFIKALLHHEQGLHIDNDHFMIISPDEGSMNRAIYLANILGVDMGMYYKRLDYSRRVNGRHPIAAYEFLGPKLQGKDMILIDDMISSGDTILKIASLLKERGAGRIYICSTFGLFTDGLEKFDDAYKNGVFDKLLTTNLVYQTPELLQKDYYISCDMSKYIALIIDTLNHDLSVSHLLNPVDRIKRCVNEYMSQYEK